MVAGIRLNSNVPVFFTNCVIEGCDEGALVTKGSLSIKDSDFISNAQPVDFDGGGDLTLEGNRWIRSTEELDRRASPVLIYSPLSIQWMIARIVERHFDR